MNQLNFFLPSFFFFEITRSFITLLKPVFKKTKRHIIAFSSEKVRKQREGERKDEKGRREREREIGDILSV